MYIYINIYIYIYIYTVYAKMIAQMDAYDHTMHGFRTLNDLEVGMSSNDLAEVCKYMFIYLCIYVYICVYMYIYIMDIELWMI
jgi:hypothetical protein